MKIDKFQATGIHGYLEFDVPFNVDLTYLTGANGSGKTTVVQSIISLISPNFLYLANTEFSEMSVTLEHDGEEMTVSALSKEGRISIYMSGVDDVLEIKRFDAASVENYPPHRQFEAEIDFYHDQESAAVSNSVFQKIQKLPTPMFLGLERRTERDEPRVPPRQPPKLYRRRNVFGGTLQRSLIEASRLAARQYQAIKRKEGKVADKLRQDIILTNFEFVEVFPETAAGEVPSCEEREFIQKKRSDVKATLISLGLPEKEIDDYVDNYFDKLENILNKLPKSNEADFVSANSEAENDESSSAIFNWITNKWQFHKLTRIVNYIEEYNKRIGELNYPLTLYQETVNQFLSESNKTVKFDGFGDLEVQIGDLEPRPITSLSSGEQQLVVILTHIAFNPDAQAANVLIIDEPELSLHVAWQEYFVEALQGLNPNLQYILATHSPSIVLDDVDHCFDLIEDTK